MQRRSTRIFLKQRWEFSENQRSSASNLKTASKIQRRSARNNAVSQSINADFQSNAEQRSFFTYASLKISVIQYRSSKTRWGFSENQRSLSKQRRRSARVFFKAALRVQRESAQFSIGFQDCVRDTARNSAVFQSINPRFFKITLRI